MSNLSDFLLQEMTKRGLSARAFAKWLGVAHTTINRMLDAKSDLNPDTKTLVVLSEKLDVDIELLFSLIRPNFKNTKLKEDPEALIMAYQIMDLPPDKRELVMKVLVTMVTDGNQNSQ